MRKIDFIELRKRLNIDYSNKQIITSSEISFIKEKVNDEIIKVQNEISDGDDNKGGEQEGIYLDGTYCHSSFQLQPCIPSKEKSNNEPFFEMSYELEFPQITYHVKKNYTLYDSIYSQIYSNYVNNSDISFGLNEKIEIRESESIFEIDDFEQPFSIHWAGEDLLSNTPILLGEISGMIHTEDKKIGQQNKYFVLPNISNIDYNVFLDISHLCNEFAFLRYCKLPYPFDDKVVRPNTQLRWLYIDKWPHLVVLSIPGVKIKNGDELIVDFGDEYHEKYVQSNKKFFKNMIVIKKSDIDIVQLCRVCKREIEQDSGYLNKCSLCFNTIHEKCGHSTNTKYSTICCLICLRKSLSIIFGFNKRNEYSFYSNKLNDVENDNNLLVNILDEFEMNKACNSCSNIFSKNNTQIEKQKSALICKIIHDVNSKIEKQTPYSIDSFYADFNSDCGNESKQVSADVKALESFHSIFEVLIRLIKGKNDHKISFFQNIQIDLFLDSFIGFYDSKARYIFSDHSIYEIWKKSKWRDFIYWDKLKKSWVGILKPNGIKSYFANTEKSSVLEKFFEAEKWTEKRLSETYISSELVDALFSFENGILNNTNISTIQETRSNIVQSTYHSPFLPTDLASHPDYKVLLNSYEGCKYQTNPIEVDGCGNDCEIMTDSQIHGNKVEEQINQNTSNSDLQLYSYSNTPSFILNDQKHQVIPHRTYIQCFSPVHRKRRVRSTLPLTSNAAKCPTEWRVRGITWHAERKAFIVPYRRDKDGGLTSTTFGAMKYGSPLTAFLKALEFRENYLKEQSTKLPEEIKQPNVICDQALLIRNLPNIIWDSSKLVWRAIAEEDLLCDDDQTQKFNLNSQDVEVDATPYGARIAYEIAEVCYIRRKALLLNSKDSSVSNRAASIGNRCRYKNNIERIGIEYSGIENQNISLTNRNSQMKDTQNPSYKKIRLKIISPSGEEVIRNDLISWHFRTNSWVISNVGEDHGVGCIKGINSFSCVNSGFRQNSLVHSLISAIECCSCITQKCQVFIHAEEAESIIESEDLAELLKPFPTGISWYCKKRRFYTSNGLDSNGRGQHFSIALYGSLIAAFNAAIDYRNIFLKNRRKNILPKIEWILCYPVNLNTINSCDDARVKDARIINTSENSKKDQSNCQRYSITNSYMTECTKRNIERMNNQIPNLNECVSNDIYHSEGVWLQHPTTVSLLEDQIINTQNDLDSQILNISILE
ncbi:hypothetical protein FG386_003220 [Cryptosporidium ryanae]|uniref:uncharacterized protein n=1 Tax=Cryptosporidium ryanae TaxID=515981 RepID=UPI00351A8C3F|nr:hypothetical protein FG386_003220 [Cryptosporidium ryanae]